MDLRAVTVVFPVVANHPPDDPGMMMTIEADEMIVPAAIEIGIMIGIVVATAMMIKTVGETVIEIMTKIAVTGTETISTAAHVRHTHLGMTGTAIVTQDAAVAMIEDNND
jgi:predicted thioesterase